MLHEVKDSLLIANKSFYDAVEARDIYAMEEIWLQSSDVRCFHPAGEVFTGWSEVRTCLQSMLDSMPPMSFTLEDVHVICSGDIAIITLREKVLLKRQKITHSISLFATNAFMQGQGMWKMILHHPTPLPIQIRNDTSFLYN
jgi:ketosteroid isomerase-like protein